MTSADKQIESFSLSWQGRERSYRLANAGPGNGSPRPLVIMLHGGGSSPELVLQKYDWAAKAASEGFLLALPEACVPFPGKPASFRHNPRAWNDGSGYGYAAENNVDDSGFISRMIDDICSRSGIDSDRIFVAGFSNGASMAMRAGLELSERIAAAGAVSGHLWAKTRPSRPVPLVYIIGGKDSVNPLEGGHSVLPWGVRIPKPPVRQTLDNWLELNGCDARPEVLQDGAGLKKVLYGSNSCELLYYEVEELGHVWPGGEEELPRNITGPRSDLLNATDAIWDFFESHARA